MKIEYLLQDRYQLSFNLERRKPNMIGGIMN